MIGLCICLTGGSDYQDMRLFGLERGCTLGDLLSLPNGVPSEDTFERVFKSINPDELEACLHSLGTQREIAELIVEKNGHCLSALKYNQKSLFEEMERAFKVRNGHDDVHETLEADHGRIETRKSSILPA
jgi:hypothetical protein